MWEESCTFLKESSVGLGHFDTSNTYQRFLLLKSLKTPSVKASPNTTTRTPVAAYRMAKQTHVVDRKTKGAYLTTEQPRTHPSTK